METQINNLQQAIQLASYDVFTAITNFIPLLIGALLIIFVGNILANWAKWIVVRLIRTLGLSKILKGSPVDKFLEKAEISQKADEVFGDIARWILLLIAFIAAVNVLGLTTVSVFLSNILTYIPNVIAAALILVLGTVIAGVVENVVKGSVSNISVSTGRLVSRISSYIVMIFAILASLAQLKIAENLIYILFIGFVATLALGFGLAFGLGAKDLVSRILDEWYTNLKKDNHNQ